jgi:Lysozyme like domain
MVDIAGSDLSFAQLEGYWIQAGGEKALAPLMAAIALAESGGNPNSVNPTDNNGTQTSWGLWQISLGNHNEPSPTWNDPLENAKLAVGKWQTQGLWAWGTYTSGAYKQFLPSGSSVPSPDLPPAPNGATEGGQGAAGTVTTQGSWTSALGTVYNDVTSGLTIWPASFLGAVGDFDTIVSDIYTHAKLFFQPSTYVRISAGIAGAGALVVALVLLVKEAKS